MSLAAKIREEARRLGFFNTAVARARPLPNAERFDRWLEAGMHGAMGYIERQAPKRRDPARVLAGARSIVTVALQYSAGEALTEDPLRGRISRYAQGTDYHRVLGAKLEELGRFVELEEPSASCLWYVDTGPVMEKAWGADGGLGWIGKHTNLITREQGSWFFIGTLLVDVELDYDPPDSDACGTCARCIEACPTGAIVAPYVVDARLCISYLTIELRGAIPRELRRLVGNRIYGCDDCQEVCPWNRFAVPTGEPELRPRGENRAPELSKLVDLSGEDFRARFPRSPVRRAGRDGFVRNVVVALGNSGSPDAVAPLARALSDASPLVRGHAAWALGQIGTPEALAFLASARTNERDPEVLDEIDAAGRPDR